MPSTDDGESINDIPNHPLTSDAAETWGAQRRSRKISELLARQIVADFVGEGVQPGDRLPTESAMIDAYEVGRATLREALRLLEVQGLIRLKSGPGGGPLLNQLSARDFGEMAKLHLQLAGATYADLIRARADIEPLLARQAAETADDEALERLDQIVQAGAEIDLDVDPAGFRRVVSWGFHVTVFRLAPNPVLNLIGEGLREIFDSGKWEVQAPPNERRIIRERHADIAAAIREHRADDAEALMRAHMDESLAMHQQRSPGVIGQRITWT